LSFWSPVDVVVLVQVVATCKLEFVLLSIPHVHFVSNFIFWIWWVTSVNCDEYIRRWRERR